MKLLLIAVILSMLSACGMYEQGTAGTYSDYQDEIPTSGNGG